MPDINIRKMIIGQLKPLLPANWALRPVADLANEITTTTVVLDLKSYERTEIAPRGPRTVRYELVIVTPYSIIGPADDAIDDALFDLLNALDTALENDQGVSFRWDKAERKTHLNHPAFVIEITTTFDLQTTEEETP